MELVAARTKRGFIMTAIPITTNLSNVSTKAILTEAMQRCPNAADLLSTLRMIECDTNSSGEIDTLADTLEREASDSAATYRTLNQEGAQWA
jgi:hypothetical protein